MRTIFPKNSSSRQRPGPIENSGPGKGAPIKWYSSEYLARIWAKRPAELLAVVIFIAIATLLYFAFASGAETNTLPLSQGVTSGTSAGTDGKVRLSQATCSGTIVHPTQDLVSVVSAAPQGTTFCLEAGVYHIMANVTLKTGDSLMGVSGSVIDAAKPISGWTQSGATWTISGLTTTPTIDLGGGYSGYQYPEAVYRDNLLFDRTLLRRIGVRANGVVSGQPASAVGTGQYFYDYDAGQVIVGSNPAGRVTEIETPAVNKALFISGSNVTISSVEVYGSENDNVVGGGRGASGLTVTYSYLHDAGGEGLRFTDGARISNNTLSHNGDYGWAATAKDAIFESNEVSFNNWSRYYQPNGACSDAGGSKLVNSDNVQILNNNYHDNLCIGLWLDINDYNTTIEGNRSDNNYSHGYLVEMAFTAVVKNNEASRNSGYGLALNTSNNVTATGNTLTDNQLGGIRNYVTDRPLQIGTNSYVTLGAHYATGNAFSANTIKLLAGTLNGAFENGTTGTAVAGQAWTSIWTRNNYTLAGSLTAPFFNWRGTVLNFAAWQQIPQDADGSAVAQ